MQFVHEKNIEIDPELENLLPPLSKEDYQMLEQSLLQNGFMQYSTRIQLWCPPEEEENDNDAHPAKSYIIDGHNRYKICQKHNIDLPSWCFDWLCFDTKEEVKKYIYENQLARRNLTPIQKISIAEQYRSIYEEQAKENQSLGGGDKKSEDYQKSVESNLTQAVGKKRNPKTDEKLSKIAGIKTTTYKMGAKVLKSDNEDLKKRVLSGETSISAGYKELMMNRNKNPKPTEKETVTPEQKIIEFDSRMNAIDKEISSLRTERESLMRRRSSLFESLDIPCELKYEFVESGYKYLEVRHCTFYIEVSGRKEVFIKCNVYCDEHPDSWAINRIPEKYKNDFIMLWKKAHKEDVEWNHKQTEKRSKEFEKEYKDALMNDIDKCKDFYKQCYKTLAKSVHPDEGGNVEAMQCLNQLKVMWGI
mgnify:CR=1 FL=1